MLGGDKERGGEGEAEPEPPVAGRQQSMHCSLVLGEGLPSQGPLQAHARLAQNGNRTVGLSLSAMLGAGQGQGRGRGDRPYRDAPARTAHQSEAHGDVLTARSLHL